MQKDKVELIIFDLDGTIVNSIFDITDGVNHVLTKMNRENVSVQEVQGSSRQREFHPKPLTEPCLKVSPHTALIIQI